MAAAQENETHPPIHGAALDRFLRGMLVGSAATRTADRNLLAVDLARTSPGEIVETEPLPPQDAFHVVLQLKDLPAHELWLDGRLIRTEHYPRQSVSIVDLSKPSRFRIVVPHEALLFYLPKPALAEVASEFGTRRFDHLRLPPGVPALDPVMGRLGAALRPRLDGGSVDRLWADQMLLLVQAHVTGTYGAARPVAPRKGALAPWQERRAKEVIEQRLEHSLTLADIAREVSLSPAHFARSFRNSTGMTPYGWLTRRRMEVACQMLRAGREPVAAITQAVGYAEQSSFTRAFLRHVGQTPSAFARLHR
jgi:AraC family transcriptional regulator